MTASGPYTESLDIRQMFQMGDLRGPLPQLASCSKSLTGIIENHPDFTKFKYILSLADLGGIYDDIQADFTLFVPSDAAIAGLPEGVLTNMDMSTARHIVRSSTLRRRLSGDILEQSPASWFTTLDPPNRLWITNISGQTYVNNDVKVIHKDMTANNGLIHVVDALLWPNMSVEHQ